MSIPIPKAMVHATTLVFEDSQSLKEKKIHKQLIEMKPKIKKQTLKSSLVFLTAISHDKGQMKFPPSSTLLLPPHNLPSYDNKQSHIGQHIFPRDSHVKIRIIIKISDKILHNRPPFPLSQTFTRRTRCPTGFPNKGLKTTR